MPSKSFLPVALAALVACSHVQTCHAFVVPSSPSTRSSGRCGRGRETDSSTATVSLGMAIGVLARKAKEADLRKYATEGIEESVMAKVDEMKEKLAAAAAASASTDSDEAAPSSEPGPLQQALTKRQGTITIIAEYKRKIEGSGFIDEVFSPEVLSPTFREFGATAVAVMADERIGGCTYADVSDFVAEQESARGDMPGPLAVICNDLIVDELQVAMSAAVGAQAVVVSAGVVGSSSGGGDRVAELKKCADALGLETIVAVSTREEAQAAVDAGAVILEVLGVDGGAEAKADIVADLTVPEGRTVCTIANILAKDNKALEEVEEAWMCRDKGFNAVWVSDALYKSGADPNEHPGAIIKAMSAKSSVKWASAMARSGKGEGAREYLGDILM